MAPTRQPPLEKPRFSSSAFRRIGAQVRAEAGPIALATLFLLLGSTMGLVFPQAMRLLIDESQARADPSFLDRVALGLVAVFVVQSLAIGMRYRLFNAIGERVVTRVRQQLFDKLMDQELAFFDGSRTGELTNRLGSDATVLQNAVSGNISMALRHGVSVFGGGALLAWTSPRLTLLMGLVIPPVAIGAVMYGRRVRGLSRQVQDALAEASDVAEESISGVRTVRSFAAEDEAKRRYAEATQRSYELAVTRGNMAATFGSVASFFGYGSAALVLWQGGRMVAAGELTVGALSSFLVYTLLVAFSLGALSDLWADLMRASGAAERVFELLDRQPAMPSRGGLTPEVVQGAIRFEAVDFAYPARPDAPVLRGFELSVKPGEVVALVGPSGAGKSTVAQLLTRLYDPQAGHVLLDGHELKTLDPTWLRQRVGVVSQEPLLFSGTVAENIRYGRPSASDAEVERAARLANAHDFVTNFPEGYATRVGERGIQLSGGQKQRVAIARAVLKDPPLLVLDEATSALDAESEHLVKEALDRLMKGRTTLVIAHRLSTVADADRVVVVEGGKVVQQGPHAALAHEEGLYKRLVERQFVAA